MRFLGQVIKSAIITTILVVAIIFIYKDRSTYRTKIPLLVENIKQVIMPSPCSRPIRYDILMVDPRFKVSKATVIADAEAAAKVWNDALGKNILVFASSTSDADVDVNLMFDYRQNTTNQLQQINSQIKGDRVTYDSLKAEYSSLYSSYTSLKQKLANDISTYNAHKTAYENNVQYWNNQGGAPSDQYNQAQTQLSDLNAEAANVRAEQNEFNALVDKVNITVSELNKLATSLNLQVTNYNSIGRSTGKEFNEGEYIEDANGKRIDIYEFSNNAQLVRVLEHEMGHALGLDHVSDPNAIMYALNQSSNRTLTAADLAELEKVCFGK